MGYGYGSLHGVPYLRTYEDALNRYEKTKPIRGTDNERRLGNRKHQHLRIQKREDNGAIECVLYQTPVITFNTDDTVVINPKSWTSTFTCSFISAVLPRVLGRHVRRRMVLEVGGKELVADKDVPLVLRWDEKLRGFEVKQAQGAWAWRINRKAANSVRSPVKEFLDFYKGFVSLNTNQTDVDDNDGEPFVTKKVMELGVDLMREVLGMHTEERMSNTWVNGKIVHTPFTYEALDSKQWGRILSKPVWLVEPLTAEMVQRRQEWLGEREYLYSLMRSDDTQDWLKAALIMLALELRMTGHIGANGMSKAGLFGATNQLRPVNQVSLAYSAAVDLPTQFLTYMFAEEVLDYVQMPVGYVPKTDHNTSIFQDVAQAKIKQATGRG